ncbi:MAG: phosphodiester glycosidase family protein [Firmicutes bacterium]|nr:phosphodiester glycosidase family protein [Bacillota bacterium]
MIILMGLLLSSNSPAPGTPEPSLTPLPAYLPALEVDIGIATASPTQAAELITARPVYTTQAPTQAPAATPTEVPASLKTPVPAETPTLAKTPAPSETPAPVKTPAPAETSIMDALIHDAMNTARTAQSPLPAVTSWATAPVPTPTPLYSYSTADLHIDIRKHTIKNVVYFTAEIWLTDVSQLRSAFSSDRFDSAKETVKDIASRNNAILAINGDFATFNNGGIIIRNGVLYRSNRSTRHLLMIDQHGDFIPYTDPPQNAEEAAAGFVEQGIWQTLVFGPLLVQNGQAVPLPEKFFISTGMALEPRTAVAQIGPLHYLWIVVDGRQEGYSKGVSLIRLQELFLQYGAQTAFNLDGGGSTTLYYMGNVLNRPANAGSRQRDVPDILYIGP